MTIDKIKSTGIKTDSQIKQIIRSHKGGDDVYSIQGYKGLNLYIRDNKTTTFRHRFTSPVSGKRVNQTLGTYPFFTLEQARDRHRSNLELLNRGIDPSVKQQKLVIPTFFELSQRWFDEQKQSGLLHQSTIKQKRRYIDYLNRFIGDMPINLIETPHILKAIKEIEKDKISTAKRIRGVSQKIFALAIGEGFIQNNPSIPVSDLMLAKPKTKHHSAITDPEKFAKLLQDIDNATDSCGHAKNIIKLQALLFQRSSDMCSMRWDNIDFDKKQWVFKPLKSGNRSDMATSLVVPLSKQAINILIELHKETGNTPFVFHNRRNINQYERKTQLNRFLWKLNYKDIHTPHGFRASAITMIQEQLKYPKHLPDMQAGHKIKDNNGEAYNRVAFIDERTEMMQKWADYLDSLKNKQ